IRPYVFISRRRPKKQKALELRWRHQTSLPKSAGYESGAYLGSAWKEVQRVELSVDRLFNGGLLIEKDPGEPRWTDHLVGFVETDRIPGGSRAIVGNFRIESGQGLVLWGPYGLSKGADPVATVTKHPRGAVGYTYADENSYLTGVAIESAFRGEEIMLFASRTPIDATFNTDETVRSIPTSGLHRTQSEIEKKNILREEIAGGRLTTFTAWGTVGMTAWWSRYSHPIQKTDPTRYHFAFNGKQNSVVGADWDITLARLNLTGEIARSQSGGSAFIGNAIVDINNLTFVLSCRHFDPDFHNPRSHSFGSAEVCNEEGVYLGFAGKLSPSTRVSLAYDLLRKPWRTYTTPVPTRGNDLLLQIEQKWSRTFSSILRARLRQDESLEKGSVPPGREVDILQNRFHHLLRFELRYHPTRWLQLRTRFEGITVLYPGIPGAIHCTTQKETGRLIYQDIRVEPHAHIRFSARWIFFDTPSYDSRVYEFENDLPGVLTIRSVYGRGIRWYLLCRWQTLPLIRLTAKFGSFIRFGVSSIGSGNDRIRGNTEREFGLQMDIVL
ncbi:MAG: hypothetical protein ABIL68_15085, partial [bacterium]